MKKLVLILLSLLGAGLVDAQRSDTTVNAGPDTSICQGYYVQLTCGGAIGKTYHWSPGEGLSDTTICNPLAFPFITTTYTLTVTDSSAHKSYGTVTITVYPSPPTPTMTQSHDTLFCNMDTAYVSYQWYLDTNLIPGATNSYIVMTYGSCNYNVQVTDKYGCSIAVGINILCGPPSASFSASRDTICQNDCINFAGLDLCCISSWFWTFEGADSASSTIGNPQGICYYSPGTFNVKLVASQDIYQDSVTQTVVVNPLPPLPTISFGNGDTLLCSYDLSYVYYQWYEDYALIPGSTNSFCSPIDCFNHSYSVSVTNSYGCKSNSMWFHCEGVKQFLYDEVISVSPNPATNQLTIQTSSIHNEAATLSIINLLGETIYTEQFNSKPETVNCKPFPSGIYFVQLTTEKERCVGKFVKQ